MNKQESMVSNTMLEFLNRTRNRNQIITDSQDKFYTALLYFEFKRRISKISDTDFKYLLPEITLPKIPPVIYLDQSSKKTILDLIIQVAPQIEKSFGIICDNCKTPNLNLNAKNFNQYALSANKIVTDKDIISDSKAANLSEVKAIWRQISSGLKSVKFDYNSHILGLHSGHCVNCEHALPSKNNCIIFSDSEIISLEDLKFNNLAAFYNLEKIEQDIPTSLSISGLNAELAFKILIEITKLIVLPSYFIYEFDGEVLTPENSHTYLQINSNTQHLLNRKTILQSLDTINEIADFYVKLIKSKEQGLKRNDFLNNKDLKSVSYQGLLFSALPYLSISETRIKFSHLRKTMKALSSLPGGSESFLLGYPQALVEISNT